MNGDQQHRTHDEKRTARKAAERRKAARHQRVEGSFAFWCKAAQTSPGWRRASHTARSLIMDMVHSGLNGRLSASLKYLGAFGWTSSGTVSRAVAELIACGLLVETRKGARPNRAAWYAVTWLGLQHTEGLDIDPKSFVLGGYLQPEAPEVKPQRKRTAAATAARQMQAIARVSGYTLAPSDGRMGAAAAPSDGRLAQPISSSDGAIRPEVMVRPAPSDGEYLEIAICPRRMPAAATRIGLVLSQRVRHGYPLGFQEARRRMEPMQ